MAPPSPGWRRRLLAIAVVAAVASPLLRNRDSFPLSTFPMYAFTRGEAVAISTAVGIDDAGMAHTLSLSTIADTDDPLIAESLVDHAIRTDRAEELCADIAARAPPDMAAIEVVEERHDIVARAEGKDSRLSRSVHARCVVRT